MSYKLRRLADGRFVCEICNRGFWPAKNYQLLCTPCSQSLKRFENTKGSGDTFDILVWAARRARRFLSDEIEFSLQAAAAKVTRRRA